MHPVLFLEMACWSKPFSQIERQDALLLKFLCLRLEGHSSAVGLLIKKGGLRGDVKAAAAPSGARLGLDLASAHANLHQGGRTYLPTNSLEEP